MCILSKDVEPAGTIMFLEKKSVFARRLIYSVSLIKTGENNNGIMLLPIFVAKKSELHFADLSDDEETNNLIDKYNQKIEFKRMINEDEADYCLQELTIKTQKLGKFEVSQFTATKRNIDEIELKFGNPKDPYFDLLGREEIFPQAELSSSGEWIYILASFKLEDSDSPRYTLRVDYEVPSSCTDFAPTIHEKMGGYRDYDAIILINWTPSLDNLIAFVPEGHELKWTKIKDSNGKERFYFGFCSDKIPPQYPSNSHDLMFFPFGKNEFKKRCAAVNGKYIRELLVCEKLNVSPKVTSNERDFCKFYLCGKQVENRMLKFSM